LTEDFAPSARMMSNGYRLAFKKRRLLMIADSLPRNLAQNPKYMEGFGE
jgi:hypothetical protein